MKHYFVVSHTLLSTELKIWSLRGIVKLICLAKLTYLPNLGVYRIKVMFDIRIIALCLLQNLNQLTHTLNKNGFRLLRLNKSRYPTAIIQYGHTTSLRRQRSSHRGVCSLIIWTRTLQPTQIFVKQTPINQYKT